MIDPQRRNVAEGIAWMVVTSLLFVCMTGVVRHIGSDLPAAQTAFIRYALGLLVIWPVLLRLRRRPPDRSTLWLFALRGAFHGIGVVLWFYAMARIPIAEVTAIGYLSPIFMTIGAALFLGERLQVGRVVAVLAAFAGVLVIVRPGFTQIQSGQLAQLAAAPLFAGSYILAKKLTSRADPGVIVAVLSVTTAILLFLPALMVWRTPTAAELGWIALTAVFATAGHYTQTQAFRLAPITVTQPAGFLQLVWAVLLGLVVFDEPLDPYVLLGGGIIIAAVTIITHREARATRQ